MSFAVFKTFKLMIDKSVDSLQVFCRSRFLLHFQFLQNHPIQNFKIFEFLTHFIEFLKKPDHLAFANITFSWLLPISSFKKARFIVKLGIAGEFFIKLEIYWGETRFVMNFFKNANLAFSFFLN